MMPALIPVPSIPCSISRTQRSAMKSLSLPQKLRGTSSQQPVQQMNCTPVRSETSFISATSRPRSRGETSTTVSTPPFLALVNDSRAMSRASSRNSSSGYVALMPADESIRCSWGKVNPRSAVSSGPSTEFMEAMRHLRASIASPPLRGLDCGAAFHRIIQVLASFASRHPVSTSFSCYGDRVNRSPH